MVLSLSSLPGTRMYEMKKLAAQKTIEKKQTKVEEINKLLADEITPTLEKLRKERAAYQQVRPACIEFVISQFKF